MSFSTETATQSPRSNRAARKRPSSWSELWLKNTKSLNHVIQAMQFQNLSSSSPKSPKNPSVAASDFAEIEIDRTVLLPDEVVLRILAKVPDSQRNHNFLVCKRWLDLQGRLVRSLKVLDWGFLESGRLISRFPNLSHVNLVRGCVICPRNVGILMHRGGFSLELGARVSSDWRVLEENLLPSEVVDEGLRILANGCPNLRKLEVIGATEMGVLSVAEECSILQELELHRCSDNVLRGIAACTNLQVLKLIGNVDGLYGSVVSDIGLTILAQGCKRLVKLELGGCEGSFDGIKAIGQCCHMLEELTLSDHRMEGGWLAGLSYCENLKTLRFQSCRSIDSCPEIDEYLGSCPTVERLHLQKCQLRDKQSLRALFTMCRNVKEIVIQDCWGLDNGSFSLASICRSVKFLSLEGCSLLTTEGLESVILHYKDLESLGVVSCNNIRDSEVSPSLSTLFSILKELKWRPDTKSLLSSCLEGTGIRKKGSKFFRKTLKL